jgi:hypothetical protein
LTLSHHPTGLTEKKTAFVLFVAGALSSKKIIPLFERLD